MEMLYNCPVGLSWFTKAALYEHSFHLLLLIPIENLNTGILHIATREPYVTAPLLEIIRAEEVCKRP